MTASIWQPGSTNVPSVDPASQLVSQSFVATEGQTDFNITQFTYSINSGALTIFVNRAKLDHTLVTELTTTSFRIPACEVGDDVEVVGNVAIDDPSLYADAAAASAAEALGYKNQAATSASNAAASESNAANSAAAALVSENNADTSEANALASKNAAATSEANALTYKNAAEAAKTAAELAEDNAVIAQNAAQAAAVEANDAASEAASSATSASNSAAAAADSYDSFDDRYLGSKASNPSLDNDGNPLLVGALYWNSVANEMRAYSGTAWLATYLPAAAYVLKTGDTMTGSLSVPSLTVSAGTVNSVAYLNGSKALTTGSSLYFDGTNLGIGTATPGAKLAVSDSIVKLIVNPVAASSVGYFGCVTNHALGLLVNNTERMRLDTSGNLGLGVTPSAWGTYSNALQGTAYSLASNGVNNSAFGTNWYFSGSDKYRNNGYAQVYLQGSDGSHKWYVAPSGTAGNTISFTQAMTLDASGNVLIGGTSNTSGNKFKVWTTGTFGSATDGNISIQKSAVGGDINSATTVGGIVFGDQTDTNSYAGRIACVQQSPASTTSTYLSFYTNSGGGNSTTLERVRIDTSGNLLVGTTDSNPVGNRIAGTVIRADGGLASRTGSSNRDWGISATSGSIVNFYSDNGSASVYTGSIFVAGNITTYSSVSDYRLKENIQPMQNALGIVAQLHPVTYNWKADGSAGQGFIAHELQAVVPDCVTGEKDAVDSEGKPVYQGIDTSFLVATLAKAIQELDAKIPKLEEAVDTEVTPLEECKAKAKVLIAESDWSVLPDVNILNRGDFENYRSQLRGLILWPMINPVWPDEPQPVWATTI